MPDGRGLVEGLCQGGKVLRWAAPRVSSRVKLKTWAPRAGRQGLLLGGTPSAWWQTLQPVGWEVAGVIFLLDISFKTLARVVLGRGPSYFTISSLQLDLRFWKLG
ncbi:hypothetical protein Tco_0216424 [Tanacetum coccineum]